MAPLTSILKTTLIKFLTKNLISIDEGNTIDKVGSGVNKIGGAKSKNIIMPNFLVKFKSLVKSSFVLSFLTFGARLAFSKLRQAFIEISIFYNFNQKCHICIATDISSYIISKIFS